jgi:hypothetical protein
MQLGKLPSNFMHSVPRFFRTRRYGCFETSEIGIAKVLIWRMQKNLAERGDT